jgi:hypothetical protein
MRSSPVSTGTKKRNRAKRINAGPDSSLKTFSPLFLALPYLTNTTLTDEEEVLPAASFTTAWIV